MAASGCALATTGGTFMMTLWRPGTSYFQVKSGLTMPLNQPVPQIATMIERMIHGTHAIMISRELAVRVPALKLGISAPGTPAPRAAGRASAM